MPAVCRGNSVDSDVAHCSTPLRDQCSSDVFVDGTGVSRQGDNNSFQQFDVSLIKQNLLNHLNIRQGEKLSDPRFGCIIWDALYEPLTAQLKDAITANVTNIVNYDPRTRAAGVQVSEYESGLQIECTLMYLDYNISEQLKLQFDKSVGLS